MTSVQNFVAEDASASEARLFLVGLTVDLMALARWTAGTRQAALRDDLGYALHAALKATLGERAPKPFALMRRPDSVELVGYARTTEHGLRRALELAQEAEPAAAAAIGLRNGGAVRIKPMPTDWRSGERFSFEVRVAPVVRSRQPDGSYPEVDAAFHSAFCADSAGDRESAHRTWLAKELARGGAATLLHQRVVRFELSEIARRYRISDEGARSTRGGLLPDLSVRGQLRVEQPQAFAALLERGLGRHRSFGFGCLLLAPAGTWA